MDLVYKYLVAKQRVIDSGFACEIDWQEERSLQTLTEEMFLREIAWVILSTGMKETVVRRFFPGVSASFLNWCSATAIERRYQECIVGALRVFNHQKKIDAIGSACLTVSKIGFLSILQQVKEEGVGFLRGFSFIGPITQYHLAKNIGLQVVKPDRHLQRIAKSTGYESPTEVCSFLAIRTGDSLSVVDMVLWRYATLDQSYCDFFDGGRAITSATCTSVTQPSPDRRSC